MVKKMVMIMAQLHKKIVMAMALLGLLILVALARRVEGGDDHTYVNNLSSKPIRGTTSYNFPFASSKFVNRLIPPNSYQVDEFNEAACQWSTDYPDSVNIELWIDGSTFSNSTTRNCDVSVVAFDSTIIPGGVDIFQSKYGYINTASGTVLFSIY